MAVVTRTTYANLQEFRQFLIYPFLNDLNMLHIAKEVSEIEFLYYFFFVVEVLEIYRNNFFVRCVNICYPILVSIW